MTLDTPPVVDHKVRYWSKIAIFALVTESLLEYCHHVWYEKTGKVWLCDFEKSSRILLLVLIEYRYERDGQTDGHTDTVYDGIDRAYA